VIACIRAPRQLLQVILAQLACFHMRHDAGLVYGFEVLFQELEQFLGARARCHG
jgi:hypothetical protein